LTIPHSHIYQQKRLINIRNHRKRLLLHFKALIQERKNEFQQDDDSEVENRYETGYGYLQERHARNTMRIPQAVALTTFQPE